ncbi:MAG: glycosyltransferase, partial [Candidatus Moranbacteria bacterium]|nr:glycosyltransferase [Candidatus Moranbacteria bacterium]
FFETMKTPKFSILIPIIKRKFLAIAIESVLKQSFSDWELILYNDCSPDNIEAVTEKFKDERVRYYKGEKNLGAEDPSKTWNRMLELANGQFVCLLGDDDFLSENFLEEMDKLTLKYPNVDLFRAGLKRVDENNETIFSGEELPELETWEQLMYQRNVKNRVQCTTGFVLRKDALLKIGGYVNFPHACGSDDATYLLLAKNNGVASTNKAFGYWRKSALNISDNASQEMNEYKKKFYLKWESDFLDSMFSTEIPIHALYRSTDGQLAQLELESQLAFAKGEVESTKKELDSTKTQLDSARTELESLYGSREWKAVLMMQKIAKILIPKGSSRRKVAVISWRTVKISLRMARKTKRNIARALRRKKRRKINLKSKKIAYIGHSYHNKTKSTEFLINYLKQSYDVKVISDESWQGKPFPDLSFIDDSYLGVIFFQLLPPRDILDKIDNNNIMYFPMYGGVRLDHKFWNDLQDLKIANFSRTLHEKLKRWGFESMYIQYFPEVQKFIPGEKEEVFFWQRLTKLNINVITKLFGKEKLKIHIHKGIDPYEKFVEPSQEDEKKFQITYSDWFESRDEMIEKIGGLIKQKGIYVAPRDLEGIGMSFLEAMAMGKAVIAVDNPTMNEYIDHGKTGYLFDLKNPKKIDLSNIEQVQKNAFDFMREGRKKWEKDKEKIIDFIRKS